ncbi:MAG: MBL fold metallo-hydrolase [archaeon GB-1867-005]|nr:MBL fold metallo-hydrolase [Candidatus Culexmicrobium cathedralense]
MSFLRKNLKEALKNLYEIPISKGEVALLYLKYSGVIVRTESSVFAFDPADLLGKDEVDLLLKLDALIYTHGHTDHYNKIVAKLIHSKTGAHVIAEPLVARDLMDVIPSGKLILASPGNVYDLGKFKVTPIKGLHRGPINLYLIEGEDLTIFHGGDSAYVPLESYRADLAMVPTGTPSPTASPQDAFKMVSALKPKAAAAFHGSKHEHQEFIDLVKRNLPQVKAIALEEKKLMKLQVGQ